MTGHARRVVIDAADDDDRVSLVDRSMRSEPVRPRRSRASAVPGAGRLRVDLPPGEDELVYLARQVSRRPDSAKLHLLRVSRHLERADAVGAHGALVDLFIGLGPSGRALQERALAAARGVVGDGDLERLRRHLDRGLAADDPDAWSPASVLCLGVLGTSRLVLRVRSHRRAGRDPIEEAIELLGHGQPDAARDVLEQAVLAAPQPARVHALLLDIYRRAGDERRLAEVRDRLRRVGRAVPELWDHEERIIRAAGSA